MEGTVAEPQVLRAERFELVDALGNVCAFFGLSPDGLPALALLGTNGRIRAWLGLDGKGSQFMCADDSGTLRIAISLKDNGSPAIDLWDAAGVPRADVSLEEDGSAWAKFRDSQGRTRAAFGVAPDGSPTLTFLNDAGTVRCMLGRASDDGVSALSFFDDAGALRATICVGSDGLPSVILGNKDGSVSWSAP